MKPAEFWKLIERIDAEALQRGDEDGAIAPLAAADLYIAGEDEDGSLSTSVSYESGSNKAKW